MRITGSVIGSENFKILNPLFGVDPVYKLVSYSIIISGVYNVYCAIVVQCCVPIVHCAVVLSRVIQFECILHAFT